MDFDPITSAQEWLHRKAIGDDQARLDQSFRAVAGERRGRDLLDNEDKTALTYPKMWDAASRLKGSGTMITPQQGLSFLTQMQNLQKPGGAGIGAPPAGSPTQGLIARLMSDNPGGVLGALMKQNDLNQPGSLASAAPGMALPAQPDAAGGPPQAGMLAGLLAKLKGQQLGMPAPGAAPGAPMNIGAPQMPNLDAMTSGAPPAIGDMGGW